MDTDNEEEKDIESETEEDRAFLDADEVEEQGVSFYRAFDREREEQQDSQDYFENTPQENHCPPSKTKIHPLKKLRERFKDIYKNFLS